MRLSEKRGKGNKEKSVGEGAFRNNRKTVLQTLDEGSGLGVGREEVGCKKSTKGVG